MFKLGEMFVAFVGKDGGLSRTMKTMEGLGKVTGKVMEKAIKEGGKMGQAGLKSFEKISAAGAKCAASVSKSFERITSAGLKSAARITPAFLRSFDKLTGNLSKMTMAGMKSFTGIGKEAFKALGKGTGGLGGVASFATGAVGSLASGVSAAGKSIAGGFGLAASAAGAFFSVMTVGLAATVAAGAGLAALIGVVTLMAADAQEMQGKFDVVFGDSAPKATAELGKMATAMGRSHVELKTMASGLQDLLVPIGFARDKAAGMSVKISQLAVDIASFNNKADSEVMEDISAALAGSGEVMKKYGVILNDVTMKQELAKMGYHGATDKANEQMKALARLNIIIAGTSDAHGDAVKTGGSFSNQMKRIMGLIKDIGTNIGYVFLPAAETFAKFFSDNLALISENSETLEVYGDVLKEWAEMIVMWLQRIITLFANWEAISTQAFNTVASVARTSLDVIITMLDNVEIFILNMFGHLMDFFPNFLSTVAETHGSLWSFLKRGWGELWDFIASGGTNAIEMDLDKVLAGMKDKMKSLAYKPIQTGEAMTEWNKLLTIIDSKMAAAVSPPALDKIERFNPEDVGVKAGVGKAIKFEMVNAADLWKKNLEDAFDKEGQENQLETLKKGVQVAEEHKKETKSQTKILGDIDKGLKDMAVVV